MLKGGCLCGGIQYEAQGPLRLFARCHCVQCRKASGAEFATNATVASEDFKIVKGEKLLKAFESSPGQARVFCARCGSPILKRKDDTPEEIRIRLGSLDSDVDERPGFHVFVSEKPNWSEIHDDLPQFATAPKPQRDA